MRQRQFPRCPTPEKGSLPKAVFHGVILQGDPQLALIVFVPGLQHDGQQMAIFSARGRHAVKVVRHPYEHMAVVAGLALAAIGAAVEPAARPLRWTSGPNPFPSGGGPLSCPRARRSLPWPGPSSESATLDLRIEFNGSLAVRLGAVVVAQAPLGNPPIVVSVRKVRLKLNGPVMIRYGAA